MDGGFLRRDLGVGRVQGVALLVHGLGGGEIMGGQGFEPLQFAGGGLLLDLQLGDLGLGLFGRSAVFFGGKAKFVVLQAG